PAGSDGPRWQHRARILTCDARDKRDGLRAGNPNLLVARSCVSRALAVLSLTPFYPLHIMPLDSKFRLPFHTVMTSFSKTSLAGKWARVRKELSHAFSTKPEAEVFTCEDLLLLDRVADAVVKRGMTAPATIFLESLGPMNFLGSQALYFLTPIIEWALDTKE